MNRRTYLGRLTAIGAIATAGCTTEALEAAEKQPPVFEGLYDEEEVDLPVTQQFDVVVAGIERAASESFDSRDEFADYLSAEDMVVEDFESVEEEGKTILELSYEPGVLIDRGNAHGLGLVAGGYASLVRDGIDSDRLDAKMLAPGGRQYGVFEVETPWAEEYVDGTITVATFGSEVLHTLETEPERPTI